MSTLRASSRFPSIDFLLADIIIIIPRIFDDYDLGRGGDWVHNSRGASFEIADVCAPVRWDQKHCDEPNPTRIIIPLSIVGRTCRNGARGD